MSEAQGERESFAAFLLRARAGGLVDKALIAAIEATPRRGFVPGQWQAHAWSDRMLPIECGEAIEGVDFQAKILASLALEPSHRVLEIGTGSGFTAAVMGRLSARVLTVERYRTLAANARQRLEALGITNVAVRHMDGVNGVPSEGPFDRIVVWAAFDGMPRTFVDQLASGGVLIAPIGPAEGVQQMARLTKVGSRFDREDIATARLQPLMAGVAAAI
nr:protein-L-isoaspartate(D-aspartate) O-methyltransferase [Mesorhizobium sp.]